MRRITRFAAPMLALALLSAAPGMVSADDRFPRFAGSIAPIATPVPAEYGSFEMIRTYTASHGIGDTLTTRSSKTHHRVERRGDTLLHRIERLRMHDDLDPMSTEDWRALSSIVIVHTSDLRGHVTGTRLEGVDTAAALRPDDPAYRAGTDEHAAFLASLARGGLGLPPLVSDRLRTGALLVSVQPAAVGEAAAASLPDDAIETRVAGWGELDGRRVLVATITNTMRLPVPPGYTGVIETGGYSLFDAQTLAPLREHVVSIVTVTSLQDGSGEVSRLEAITAATVVAAQ